MQSKAESSCSSFVTGELHMSQHIGSLELFFSSLCGLYNNIHIYFRYQNDYSILYERKCIHKNIMSFTKYLFFTLFSYFLEFCLLFWSLRPLIFSINHATIKNPTDISPNFHLQAEKRRIFHLFFCCSVINVIQQLYRATSRCAPSLLDRLAKNDVNETEKRFSQRRRRFSFSFSITLACTRATRAARARWLYSNLVKC